MTDDTLTPLAIRTGEALKRAGWVLATAESCTAGWIAKVVTDVSGSSDWFDRGFVTYSNAAKREMLGVPELLLAQHGAVSEAVVRAMVAGALERSRAHIVVAVSGVAGPTGGSADKPVGLVWLAWGTRGASEPRALSRRYGGNRDDIRRAAVVDALQGVLQQLPGG